MINLGTGILKLDFSPWMLVKGHSALHGTYSILPSSKAQGSSCQILDKIIGLGLVTRKRYSALAQDMLRSHSKSPRWSCDRKTLTVGNITFQWCVVVASCFCVFINTYIIFTHPQLLTDLQPSSLSLSSVLSLFLSFLLLSPSLFLFSLSPST